MDSENLAYRGITSGDSGCIAYRGYICGIITQYWRSTIRIKTKIQRIIQFDLEL